MSTFVYKEIAVEVQDNSIGPDELVLILRGWEALKLRPGYEPLILLRYF